MSLQQHLGCVQDIHDIAKYSQVEKVIDLCLSSFIPILPTGHIAIVNKKHYQDSHRIVCSTFMY